jgi:hypothetical protein
MTDVAERRDAAWKLLALPAKGHLECPGANIDRRWAGLTFNLRIEDRPLHAATAIEICKDRSPVR